MSQILSGGDCEHSFVVANSNRQKQGSIVTRQSNLVRLIFFTLLILSISTHVAFAEQIKDCEKVSRENKDLGPLRNFSIGPYWFCVPYQYHLGHADIQYIRANFPDRIRRIENHKKRDAFGLEYWYPDLRPTRMDISELERARSVEKSRKYNKDDFIQKVFVNYVGDRKRFVSPAQQFKNIFEPFSKNKERYEVGKIWGLLRLKNIAVGNIKDIKTGLDYYYDKNTSKREILIRCFRLESSLQTDPKGETCMMYVFDKRTHLYLAIFFRSYQISKWQEFVKVAFNMLRRFQFAGPKI